MWESSHRQNFSGPFHSRCLARPTRRNANVKQSNIALSKTGCSSRTFIPCNDFETCRNCSVSVNSVTRCPNFKSNFSANCLICNHDNARIPRESHSVTGGCMRVGSASKTKGRCSKRYGNSNLCKYAHGTCSTIRAKTCCRVGRVNSDGHKYVPRKNLHALVRNCWFQSLWPLTLSTFAFCANIWQYILFDYFRCRAYYRVIIKVVLRNFFFLVH